jgi:hypothetical protein
VLFIAGILQNQTKNGIFFAIFAYYIFTVKMGRCGGERAPSWREFAIMRKWLTPLWGVWRRP